MRRGLMMVAAGLAVLAVAPGPAGAMPTVLEYDSATLVPDAPVAGKVQCAAGKKLLGGGFALDPAHDPVADTGAEALVQRSFPAEPRIWTTRGFATPGGTESTFFTAGACRKTKLTRPSISYPIAAETHLVAPVTCKPNRHVTGGGYSIFPTYDPATATGANVSIHTSRRIDEETWLIGATRDFGEEATVTAFAICERDFRGAVSFAKEKVDAEDVGTYTATAECPGSKEVVSGGFKTRPLGTPGSAMSTGLFPWISVNGPPPDKTSWMVTVHNAIGSIPGAKLTAYAYCKAI